MGQCERSFPHTVKHVANEHVESLSSPKLELKYACFSIEEKHAFCVLGAFND